MLSNIIITKINDHGSISSINDLQFTFVNRDESPLPNVFGTVIVDTTSTQYAVYKLENLNVLLLKLPKQLVNGWQELQVLNFSNSQEGGKVKKIKKVIHNKKTYIAYKKNPSKKYLVHIDPSSKARYIKKQGTKILLSEIRGKYINTKT